MSSKQQVACSKELIGVGLLLYTSYLLLRTEFARV